jgi:hypothetical protein
MKVLKAFSWVQGDFTQLAVKPLSSDSMSARISATASTEGLLTQGIKGEKM